MRYRAFHECGICGVEMVGSGPAGLSVSMGEAANKSLALRHARAMAAVLRAAKALQKARWSQVKRTTWAAWAAAYDKAMTVHDQAVDRLVAVEKEVARG